MIFQDLLTQIMDSVGSGLLNLLMGIGILLAGWLVAVIVAALVRGVLKRTGLGQWIAKSIGDEEMDAQQKVEKWSGRIAFYLIMLFVLVAFFQTLNLTTVAEPLTAMLDQVFIFIPQLLGAIMILLVAWLIASFVRLVIRRTIQTLKLDERLSEKAALEEEKGFQVGESIATAIFWFVFLLFLPAVLSALGMEGLVEPVQDMFGAVLIGVPNVFGAGILLLVGWFIARIIRQIVTNLLTATNTDQLGERMGLTQSLSKLIGTIVYTLVLIPAVIAALNALKIEAISGPAVEMLTIALNAVPVIFGAALILSLSFLIGKLISGLVSNLLIGVGFNQWPEKLGLKVTRAEGQRTPAEIGGYVALVAIMLFAAIEAASILNFTIMADLLTNFVSFGGQILLALVIFSIGLYLANMARNVILSTVGQEASTGANIARIAILVLVGAMALRQMGIANEIVNLAFGIILGTLGVAGALAFGLGSQEIAARKLEKWIQGSNKGTDKK